MVAVEHGIYVSRVDAASDGIAVEVLYRGTGLISVVAGETLGLACERQTEARGVQVVAHRYLDVKRAQEHVACSETLVRHAAEGTRVTGRQAHGGPIIAVSQRGSGIIHRLGATHRDAESVVGGCPVIAQRTVGQRVVPHVEALIGGLQLIVLEVVEQRVGNRDECRHHAHAIAALPFAVLGCYRVDDGSTAKVVGTSAGRRHCRSGRQCEYRRQRAHVGISTHGEGDDAVGRENRLYRVRGLEEELSRVVDMQRHRLNVCLTVVRFIAKT